MVKFKLMVDKDEEVKWLNEESAKGNAFKKFILGFYFFDKCEENQYVYDIDLLTSFRDYNSFKEFMADSNVEVISRWYRWVYVRKESDSSGFELYSDVESKIEHYKRILRFFKFAFILEVLCLFIEIYIPLIQGRMRIINFIFISMIVLFSIAIFGGYSKVSEKIKFYIQSKDNLSNLN